MRNLFSPPDEEVFSGGKANDNIELLKAWAGTTLAFAVVQVGYQRLLSPTFLTFLAISGVVCGMGLILHELAHRVVARRFGAEAHFVANNGFLLISVLLAFAGVFIAAPGAVWYRGFISVKQSGQIAIAGPVTNLVLAVLFLLLLPAVFITGVVPPQWLITTCYIGYQLNAWIGLFNMIPAGPFDGAKVLAWSPLYFGITVAAGILLTFVLPPTLVWQYAGMPFR